MDLFGTGGSVAGGINFNYGVDGEFQNRGSTRQYEVVSNELVIMYATEDNGDLLEAFVQMQQLGGGNSGSQGQPFSNTLTVQRWDGFTVGTLTTGQSQHFDPGSNSEFNGLPNFERAGTFPDRHYFAL